MPVVQGRGLSSINVFKKNITLKSVSLYLVKFHVKHRVRTGLKSM